MKVTESAQLLHFKQYNQWPTVNAKKMKRTMRARLRWNGEQWFQNADHGCVAEWVVDPCKTDTNATYSILFVLWTLLQFSAVWLLGNLDKFHLIVPCFQRVHWPRWPVAWLRTCSRDLKSFFQWEVWCIWSAFACLFVCLFLFTACWLLSICPFVFSLCPFLSRITPKIWMSCCWPSLLAKFLGDYGNVAGPCGELNWTWTWPRLRQCGRTWSLKMRWKRWRTSTQPKG